MKFKLFLALLVALFAFSIQDAAASEGVFNLRNRVGEDARCTAYSGIMPDSNYNILLLCQDILYPGGSQTIVNYVVWASPSDGGNAVRLGTVGLGRAFFKTKTQFNTLFVTIENSANPRTPSGEIVMQGSAQPNEFLYGPAPTPNAEELSQPTESPVATAAPRSLGRIFAAGGILAFIAIAGVMLVIFVITRK
jgi:hypothetical protein